MGVENGSSNATVRRKMGLTPPDQITGEQTPIWAVVYADIPFRLGGERSGASGTRTITVGGLEMQVAVRFGSFPHDTDDLQDDDYIEITAGENAGLVLRIVEAEWQDQATARRVPVVSTGRPSEWAA